jgi:hypothetical protein
MTMTFFLLAIPLRGQYNLFFLDLIPRLDSEQVLRRCPSEWN